MDMVKRTLQQIQDERLPVRSRQPVRSPQQTATPARTARQILQPPATHAARRGISRRRVIVSRAGLAIVGSAFVICQGPLIIQSLEGFPQSFPQSSQGTQGQTSQGSYLLYTYRGHSNPVFAVAWSPDGKRIASGSFDTTVLVWRAP